MGSNPIFSIKNRTVKEIAMVSILIFIYDLYIKPKLIFAWKFYHIPYVHNVLVPRFLLCFLVFFLFFFIIHGFFVYKELKSKNHTENKRAFLKLFIKTFLNTMLNSLVCPNYWVLQAICLLLVTVFAVFIWGAAVLYSYQVSDLQKSNFFIFYVFFVTTFYMIGMGYYGLLNGLVDSSDSRFLKALKINKKMLANQLTIFVIFLTIAFLIGDFTIHQFLDFQSKRMWFISCFPVQFGIYYCTALSEICRYPLDKDLIEKDFYQHGYCKRYSLSKQVCFYISSWGNIIFHSAVMVFIFLGGWLLPFESTSFFSHAFWFGIKFCVLFVSFTIMSVLIDPEFAEEEEYSDRYFLGIVLLHFFLTVAIRLYINSI